MNRKRLHLPAVFCLGLMFLLVGHYFSFGYPNVTNQSKVALAGSSSEGKLGLDSSSVITQLSTTGMAPKKTKSNNRTLFNGKSNTDGLARYLRSHPDIKLEIIAHRGFAAMFPENTLPAFNGAIKLGADAVELDVQLTSDSIPVVLHDGKVDRTTNGHGMVNSFTLTKLNQLDAGERFGVRYSGTKIPTLFETLQLCRKYNEKAYVELKSETIHTPEQVERVLQDIYAANMQDKVVVTSFSYNLLKYVRALDENLPLALHQAQGSPNFGGLLSLGNIMLSGHDKWLLANPQFISSARNAGIDLITWVVPKKSEELELVKSGVYKLCLDITPNLLQ